MMQPTVRPSPRYQPYPTAAPPAPAMGAAPRGPRPARPCFFFKKGLCAKGESCNFAHYIMVCPNTPCEDEKHCPFVHPGESIIPIPAVQPTYPAFRPSVTAGPAAGGYAPQPVSLGPIPAPAVYAPAAPTTGPGYTGAYRGSYNNYQQPAPAPAVVVDYPSRAAGGGYAGGATGRPCFFFKKGNCVKGESCAFLHELVPCPNGDACTNLAKCAYTHPNEGA